MAGRQLSLVLRHLYKQSARHQGSGVSDAQLLERFVNSRDESAFELLLYRHGAMVWGVCHRVLRDHHDAEDAYQAAWLTLARKARGIGRRNAVSSWMYKVAYRIALRLQAGNRRRAERETQVDALPPAGVPGEVDFALLWRELKIVLDEEVGRLPEKLRTVVVLCYLEGKTNEEASRLLAWPIGTVKTRLSRARELLCSQLTGRGLIVSTALLAATVTSQAATVALPVGLMSPTVQAALLFSARKALVGGLVSARAVLLTKGVLQTMMTTKLKLAAVLLTVGVACTGVGFATYQSSAGEQPATGPAAAQRAMTTRGRSAFAGTPMQAVAMNNDPDILVQATEVRTGSLVFGVGVNSDAGLTGSIVLNERNFDIAVRAEGTDKKSPVAVIFGATEITREELAEYLIRRASAERIQAFVNLRILEYAANQKGIKVSSEEVDAALAKTLKELNVSLDEFRTTVLNKYNKTLVEWREDVLRARLLAEKLCNDRIHVTEEDVQRAFENAYGERLSCEVIVWPKDQEKTATEFWMQMRKNPSLFDQVAGHLVNASNANSHTFEFRRHATDNPAYEKIVFALKEDEISSLIDSPTQISVVKCRKRIPGDATKKLEDVRDILEKEVRAKKIEQEIPVLMKEMKEKAHAKMWMEP
jgi:RNA polymerase sigma factor (sigma-70 family)